MYGSRFRSSSKSSGLSPARGESSKRRRKQCAETWEFYEPSQTSSPVEFSQDTSLHGLQYVGQSGRHLIERIFWLVAFIGAVTAAGLLIYKLLDNHSNNPVETVFTGKEMPIENTPFPAVTICNVNNMRKSKFLQYAKRADELDRLENETLSNPSSSSSPPFNYTVMQQAYAALIDAVAICNTKPFSKRISNEKRKHLDKILDELSLIDQHPQLKGYQEYHNPVKILREGSQSCKDMILFCSWLDMLVDCEQIFYEVETDYGSCCTFNTIPLSLLDKYLLANDTRDPKKRVEGWRKADLSWDNLIFTEESKGRKHPRRQKYPGMAGGLTVLLNPDLKDYHCAIKDSEGFVVGVNGPLDHPRLRDTGLLVKTDAEVFVNVRPEITMFDDSIRNINLEKRNCLFGTEKPLPHYSKYTASNCLNECIANRTLAECQCVQYYMPRSNTDELCKPSQSNCSDGVQKDIMTEGLADACRDCLPTCTEIKYRTEVTALKIRKAFTDQIFKTYPELRNKSDNISIVHVYFGVDSTYPRVRKEVYSTIDLICGLLGLCMGFSMLSLLEIVYYCTLRLCCRYRRKHLEKAGTNNLDADDDDEDGRGGVFKQNWLSTVFSRSVSDEQVRLPNNNAIFKIVHHNNPEQFISSTGRKGVVRLYQ